MDFGLVGMATVAVGFAGLFKDLGTAAAIVQARDLPEEMVSSLFWANVVFGLAAAAGLVALSPAIGNLFHEIRVVPMLRVLAITFLISSLSTVHQALLQRRLAFDSIAKAEMAALAVGTAVGIGLAYTGAGSWSLIFQTLAIVLVTSALLWILSSWSPRFVFKPSAVRAIYGYSLNLTGFNIFNYLARNADNFLIGRFLGPRDLGFYALGYRIMCYPVQILSDVVGRVMFPVYSQLQDTDARFQRAYLNVTSAIAFLSFPLALGLLATRDLLVITVFGPQWTLVTKLLLILVPVGLIQSIGTTVGVIYQAKGRTDLMLRWGVVTGLLVIVSFLAGLRWGIYGVASSYAVMSFVLAIPSFVIPFRLINLKLAHFALALWRPFSCSLVMFITLLFLKANLILRVPDFAALAILVGLGVIVYFASSWFMNREQTLRLIDIIGITR
jgi:PST family polysaccharide transporter